MGIKALLIVRAIRIIAPPTCVAPQIKALVAPLASLTWWLRRKTDLSIHLLVLRLYAPKINVLRLLLLLLPETAEQVKVPLRPKT